MRIPALALVFGLLVAACGDDSVDLSSIAEDLAEEPETTPSDDPPNTADAPSTDDGEAGDDPDTPSEPSDDDTSNDSPPPKDPLPSDAETGSKALSRFFEGGVSPSSEQCMLDGLLAEPDLLGAIITAGPDADVADLSEPDQLAAVELGLSCVTAEEISASIQAGFDADVASQALAGEAADCVGTRLTDDSDPDRTQLLLALVAVGDDQLPTPEQGTLLTALMVECIDAGFLVDATLASVVDDPLLATAIDRGCLDSAIDNEAYMERFWGLFVANSDTEFEDLSAEQQLTIVGPFFECVSFGTVTAASAAEEGVSLSSDTIACIDGAIETDELVDAFVSGGELDESRFVAAVLSCLTPAELAALG